jgi:hypothetical protein
MTVAPLADISGHIFSPASHADISQLMLSITPIYFLSLILIKIARAGIFSRD